MIFKITLLKKVKWLYCMYLINTWLHLTDSGCF